MKRRNLIWLLMGFLSMVMVPARHAMAQDAAQEHKRQEIPPLVIGQSDAFTAKLFAQKPSADKNADPVHDSVPADYHRPELYQDRVH